MPTDFLNLVSDALNDAYPRTDTLEHLPREDAVSPAVYTLLDVLKGKFDSLPVDFVLQAFEAMRPGLLVWMSDDNKVVMSQHARSVSLLTISYLRSVGLNGQVDQLYVSVLHMFERAVEQGLLPRTAGSFDSLLDIVAPRLSRAASRAVPEAFQSLWSEFEGIESSQFSDETRAFLQSVIAAVPDLITVKGLSTSSAMSEVRCSLKLAQQDRRLIVSGGELCKVPACTRGREPISARCHCSPGSCPTHSRCQHGANRTACGCID